MGQKTSRRWTEENLDASITGFASVEEKQVDATLAFPFLQVSTDFTFSFIFHFYIEFAKDTYP